MDYRRLCRDLKRPVCLWFTSYRRLHECHMDLSVIYQEKHVPLVKVPKGSVFFIVTAAFAGFVCVDSQ